MLAMLNDGQQLLPREAALWSRLAGSGMLTSGVLFVGIALLVAVSAKRRWAAWLIVALCLGELLVFARTHRSGVPADLGLSDRAPAIAATRAARPRRVLEVSVASNFAMSARGYSVWGYDPVVLERYSAFMARTQGRTSADLDNVQGDPPGHFHPLLRLARLSLLIHYTGAGGQQFERNHTSLPRFVFVDRFTIRSEPGSILDFMDSEEFDPEQVMVLEAAPDPLPSTEAANGRVTIVEESTDHAVLEVDVDSNTLMLVTDAYARGWRAVALPTSVQAEYAVQPANLAFRAIALEAGLHRLRLEYLPRHYYAGLLASGMGTALYLGSLTWWLWTRRTLRGGTCVIH